MMDGKATRRGDRRRTIRYAEDHTDEGNAARRATHEQRIGTAWVPGKNRSGHYTNILPGLSMLFGSKSALIFFIATMASAESSMSM